MRMSNFEPSASLRLRSPLKSLEFSVIDSEFREVAHGIGALEVNVLPGIYELRFQAGPEYEKRLVSVAPGQVYEDTQIELAFPSPAPIQGTSTSHEFQQTAAAEASQTPTASGAGTAGLVLMVRNVRDSEHLICDESTVAALELFDSDLEPVPDFSSGWQLDSGNGWATWSAHLTPGGYALRVRRAPEREEGKPALFDQSIWLTNGWQTLVFIPNSASGPVPESASLHMAELALDWSPYEREVSSALELALWGLREGRGVLPEDLRPLLEGKFKNPMLGIIGAHSLLLAPEPDFELLDSVLENLAGLVPDHPDLTALLWLEAERRSETRYPDAELTPPSTLVAWPPLLHASYAALIRRDARDASTIADGSVAERAAAQVLSGGVWTSWEPLEKPVAAEMVPRGVESEPQLPVTPDALRNAPIADRATKRVARYLADVAEVRQSTVLQILGDLAPDQIGVAAGLPSASVNRALNEIRERTNS
jgi:hypothetical protein